MQMRDLNSTDYFDPGLYVSYTYIENKKNMHSREVYNYYDLLGEMGGVLEAMVFMLGIFIFPAKHQKFIMKIAREIFMASTHYPEEFALNCSKHDSSSIPVDSLKFNRNKNRKNDKLIKKLYNSIDEKVIQQDLKNHHVLSISSFSSIKLHLMRNYCFMFSTCNKAKLVKLYEKSEEKVEKAFDIIKIIKKL